MLPIMIPLQRRLDPDEDVGRFSVFTRLQGCVAVAALAQPAPGRGRAAVDGVPLSRWEAVPLRGIWLLFLPVGEVAWRYGRRWRVMLEGFETPEGRRFPRCAFHIRTDAQRQPSAEYAERDALALAAAREGMVLLRNGNGALPLSPEETLNCLGTAQHHWRIATAGASRINPRWRPGFHRAVAEHSRFGVNEELASFYRNPAAGAPDGAMLRRARQNGGPALVFIGRHAGEMLDSRDIPGEYRLTEAELDMLRAARAAFDRVIVILNTGGPVEMAWLREIPVDAVLFTGFAGMLSAFALVELLDGRANPSGHLPDSWPWRNSDNPVSRNFPARPAGAAHLHEDAVGVRVYYEEDVYLGYRWFDTFGVPVAFPFGHGLSYTRFELSPQPPRRDGMAVSVAVRVRNAGDRPGCAVAQLYVSPPPGALERPARLLAGFERTAELAPGEAQTLVIRARLEDIAAFDERQGAFVLEAGAYRWSVGQSLAERADCGALEIGRTIVEEVRRLGAPVERFKRLTRRDPAVDGARSKLVPLGEQIAVPAPRTAYSPAPLARHSGGRVMWREAAADPAKLEGFVAQLSLFELCRLNVCAGARWLPWQDGMAGYTPRLRRYGLPAFAASDANAGLNLRRPNIGFPASSVIAASFDRRLAEAVGRAIAGECPEHGVNMLLGPAMNLHRSPLCGRHPEYFSEDPLLTGELAGWQAKGLAAGGVACCYKHLFCNNSELGRLGSHSVVSEQALRELYFRAFRIAFRVCRPGAVMTAYNALNGLYPGENATLLQGLLRGEWGFDGAIMSDWSSTRTVSAVEMVRAGNCWITPGGPRWLWRIYRAARRGEIPRAVLENNVLGLLKGFTAR